MSYSYNWTLFADGSPKITFPPLAVSTSECMLFNTYSNMTDMKKFGRISLICVDLADEYLQYTN